MFLSPLLATLSPLAPSPLSYSSSLLVVILALQDSLQSKAGIRKRATTTAVLNAFFNEPVLSVTAVAEQAHISYNSAQAAIAELEKGKIVRELTGKQKGRIFACDPVLDAIFNRKDAFETT